MRRPLLAFALLPAFLGLACLGIGCYATCEHLAFSRDASEATGAVVELVARPGQARRAARWLTWGSKVRNWFVAGGVVALVASLATVAGALRLRR